MNVEPIVFDDLAPVEVEVKLGEHDYLLREASEDAACKYLNAKMQRMQWKEGDMSSVQGLADVGPLLVSLCLVQLLPQSDGSTKEQPVSIPTIRSWPHRVQVRLFETAKQISDIDQFDLETLKTQREAIDKRIAALEAAEDEDPAKNVPDDTEDNSG